MHESLQNQVGVVIHVDASLVGMAKWPIVHKEAYSLPLIIHGRQEALKQFF